MTQPALGSVELTENDIFAGLSAMPERKGASLILPVMLVPMLIYFSRGPNGFEPLTVLPYVALGAFGMVVPRLGLRNAARKHIASMEEPERRVEYRLDDEGLHIKTPRSTSSIAYSAIHRVVEGRTEFLVYTSAQIAQIIPKRAFDEPNVEAARSWLLERVTPRSKSRGPLKFLALWVLLIIALLFIWQVLGPAKPH